MYGRWQEESLQLAASSTRPPSCGILVSLRALEDHHAADMGVLERKLPRQLSLLQPPYGRKALAAPAIIGYLSTYRHAKCYSDSKNKYGWPTGSSDYPRMARPSTLHSQADEYAYPQRGETSIIATHRGGLHGPSTSPPLVKHLLPRSRTCGPHVHTASTAIGRQEKRRQRDSMPGTPPDTSSAAANLCFRTVMSMP